MQIYFHFETMSNNLRFRRNFHFFRLVAITLAALVWSNNAFCGEIHEAANRGDLERVISLLNFDPNLVFSRSLSELESTPLHVAATKDVVEVLLAHKADINARDKYGETPLYVAAERGEKDVVELLLARGADVDARNTKGPTGVSGGPVRLGDIDRSFHVGSTPLHRAAYYGYKDVVESLLAHGADVNAENNRGHTPLHEAADKDHKDVAESLLAHRADVNAKDHDGFTPLHEGACMGGKGLVELLLANGADINAKSTIPLEWRGDRTPVGKGWTPLREANYCSQKDVAALLRQHGGHE